MHTISVGSPLHNATAAAVTETTATSPFHAIAAARGTASARAATHDGDPSSVAAGDPATAVVATQSTVSAATRPSASATPPAAVRHAHVRRLRQPPGHSLCDAAADGDTRLERQPDHGHRGGVRVPRLHFDDRGSDGPSLHPNVSRTAVQPQ